MTKQQPIEIFMPPNMLKAKVGGSVVGLDNSAVKRAELALKNLKTEFGDWIATDVQKLATCRDAFAANPCPETLDDLSLASLDLKGQARTFEFPLVERVATSLCRLLGEGGGPSPLSLIDAHVAAIRVIVRDKIMDRANIVATTLSSELETRVSEFLARQAKR
jgi:hypothetical protein